MHAEHEHRQCRLLAPEILQQVEAAHAGQRDVQNHDVPLGAAHFAQTFFGVGGFTDEGRVERLGEHLLDALAHDRMIVDEKDARHRWPAMGTCTVTVVPRPATPRMATLPAQQPRTLGHAEQSD